MTPSWTVCPAEVSGVFFGVRESETGIGLTVPRMIAGRLTAPFAGTVKKADSPKVVTPFWTQVARAFTWPKLAGMFGSTQEPSGFTRTVRLRTLTVQFSFNCA